MDSDEFTKLFAENSVYRRHFSAWWAADYSTKGLRLRDPTHPALTQATTRFGGRTWPAGFAPPHDRSGKPNPAFELPSLAELTRPLRNGVSKIDLSGRFISSFEASSARLSKFGLEHAFVINSISLDDIRSESEFYLRNSYIHELRAQSTSTINLEIIQSYVCSINIPGRSLRLEAEMSIIDNVFLPDAVECLQIHGCLVEKIQSHSRSQVGKLSIRSSEFNECLVLDKTIQPPSSITIFESRFRKGLVISSPSLSSIELIGCNISESLTLSNAALSAKISKCRNIDNLSIESEIKGLSVEKSNIFKMIFQRSSGSKRVEVRKCSIRNIQLSQSSIQNFDILQGSIDHLDAWSCSFDNFSIWESDFSGHVLLRGSSFSGSCRVLKSHVHLGIDAGVRRISMEMEDSADGVISDFSIEGSTIGAGQSGIAINLAGRSLNGHANFSRCRVDGILYVERNAFKEDVSFSGAKFGPASGYSHPPVDRFSVFTNPLLIENNSGYSQYFERAERSFSNLKEAMKDSGSDRQRAIFYSYEIQARMRRFDGDVHWSERAVAIVYGATSEYGESISKPIFLIFLLLLICSAFYLISAGDMRLTCVPFALEFSLQQIIRPLHVWNPEFGSRVPTSSYSTWVLNDLLESSRVAHKSLLVRLVALVQSITSLAFVFLAGLALRRRFQMS